MSDIYLQITETPTVVTLSAPVISGALSSTVTVANVVTVALDSNSLSALENVTVTVGAAITGTVTVSNFPASQAVTFSAVTISNFPATQAVSLATVPTHGVTLTSTTVTVSSLPALAAGTAQIGSVTASISGTVPVSGTFWQATQPVSGTFFQATQPVSLASTTVTVSSMPAVSGSVTIGAGTAQIGSVTASISGTVPVSISSVTVGNSVTIGNFPATQAVTFGQAIVSASNITGLNNSVGTDGGTPAATNFIKIGGHQDGANSVEHIVHVSAGGSMKVDASDSTVTFGTIRGTVTIGNSVTISSLPALVAGTAQIGSVTASISNSVTIGSLPAISGSVTIGAGTAQIGSVTASVSNTNFSIKAVVALDGSSSAIVPTPQSSFRLYTPVGASKTLNNIFGANPAWITPYSDVISFFSDSGVQNNYLHDGTQWILDDFVTPAGTDALNGSSIVFNLSAESGINLSNGFTFVQLDNPLVANSAMRVSLYNSSVTANTFAIQGTAVTTSNFTSTTASTLLAAANNNRKVLTIFNEGAGNLHICAGATCTTIAYQRKLASNEFFQVPDQQTAITHSAVFATAGTARIVQIT